MEKTVSLCAGPLFDVEQILEQGTIIFNEHGIKSIEIGRIRRG